MVPDGWVSAKLGDVAELVTSGSRGWASYYSNDGDHFIRITNLRRSSILPDYSNMKYVRLPENGNEGQRTRLKKNDILISITADLGTIGFIESAPDRHSYINQHIALVRLKSGKIAPKFVAYQLSNKSHNALFQRLNDAGAKAGLNLSTIRSVPIFLPSIGEQERIAEILTTWDRAIETTEKLIANSQAQKKALMQQLLAGKKRLPGFEDKWKSVSFDQLFERVREKNAELNENVLTISAQHGLVSQTEYFNKSVAGKDLSGYTLLKRGDFAYNKSYSAGYPMGAIKPLELYDKGIVSSLYICFRLRSKEANHDFYRHYFEGGYFNREIYGIAQEGARNHGLLNVSVTDFFITRIVAPTVEEQQAIANVINAAEQEISKLEAYCRDLKSEKVALMQQLLTGKRRVKIEEAAA